MYVSRLFKLIASSFTYLHTPCTAASAKTKKSDKFFFSVAAIIQSQLKGITSRYFSEKAGPLSIPALSACERPRPAETLELFTTRRQTNIERMPQKLLSSMSLNFLIRCGCFNLPFPLLLCVR